MPRISSNSEQARYARQERLLELCRLALRAWIKADLDDVPAALRQQRLSEARKLTGDAVGAGLLRG